jgi:excinuclease ABC subunit C
MSALFELFQNKNLLERIPKEPGVYIIKSEMDEILYIGKAKNLRNRIKNYLNPSKLDIFKQSMIKEAKFVEIIVVKTELEALLLESNLIKEHRPPYNVVLRDDKSYPYLRISLSEKYPRISIARRVKNKKDFYFGPITPADNLKNLIKLLKASYKIAQKNDKSCQGANSACIYYQMNKCSAPCVGYISKDDYMLMINEIKSILSNPRPLEKKLQKELKALIYRQNFEKAIEIRDKLKAIEILKSKQSVSDLSSDFLDVIVFEQQDIIICAYIVNIRFSNIVGNRNYFFYDNSITSDMKASFITQYYSSGEVIPDEIAVDNLSNKEIIEEAISSFGKHTKISTPKIGTKRTLIETAKKNAKLALETHIKSIHTNLDVFKKIKETFGFSKTPFVIDVVDISHTNFENVVSGIVRYSLGGFDKEFYRRYSLKTKYEKDAMQETLFRHKRLLLKGYKKMPDIILVDGGLIQIDAAKRAFNKDEVIGIAKEKRDGTANRDMGDVDDIIYFNGNRFAVDKNILMFFQKLRDEAHRFAIGYHRQKRIKQTLSSALDRVEFIGPKRKRALFEKFGSIDNIRNASIDELTSIKGITQKTAQILKEKLK